MIKHLKYLLFLWLLPFKVFTQETIVKGSVLDAITGEPIPEVSISIESTFLSVKTNADGVFIFNDKLPLGEQILKLEKVGYLSRRYPIIINKGKTLDVSGMILNYDPNDKNDLYIISISDDNLNSEDDGLTDNISGLLQASRDVFLTRLSRVENDGLSDKSERITSVLTKKPMSGSISWRVLFAIGVPTRISV
jgi:hypothetical protein